MNTILITLALSAVAIFSHGDSDARPGPEATLDGDQIQAIIDTCIMAFEDYYVYPDAVAAMKSHITRRSVDGAYEKIPDLEGLTSQLRRDFRDVSGDRHIWIDIMQNIRLTPGGPTAEQIAEMKSGNFGFTSVKTYEDGIGYMKLDSFRDPAYAGDTAVQAMKKLAASRALIIDLRENHGGDGKMVHLLASYFLPAGTQLTSLYFRAEDRLREAWTHDEVQGERMLNVDLLILTSKQTASAAESFAYTLQSYGRARLVGENTRGAGHWVESFPYPDQGIFLEIPVARPINPVTKTGWEYSGIVPDVSVDPAKALDIALRLARQPSRCRF